MRMRGLTVVGMTLALVLGLAACGGESSGTTATSGSATAGNGRAGQDNTASAMEVVRTGGIAGVRDVLRIKANGQGTLTDKNGKTSSCRPTDKALDRLRAVDLADVSAGPTAAPVIADAFNYGVRVGDERASGSEGDDGRRADLVDAAAAVLTSCLQQQQPVSGGY
jgi:hypothetical protein